MSVVVPTLNAANFIERAVDSVLNQTFGEIELILVDDGSTDRTFEICVEAARHDSRVVTLKNSGRRGVGNARNLGISRARGEWIAFLDADDWFAPNRLSVLLEVGRNVKADIVADNLYLIRDSETTPWRTLFPSQDRAPRQIALAEFLRNELPRGTISGFGLLKPLIRRVFLEENSLAFEEVAFAEDFLFMVTALALGAHFYLHPMPMYYYRRHAGNSAHRSDLFQLLEETNSRAMSVVFGDAECMRLLVRRGKMIRDNRIYAAITTHTRTHQIWKALALMVTHPDLLPLVARRVTRAVLVRTLWRNAREV